MLFTSSSPSEMTLSEMTPYIMGFQLMGARRCHKNRELSPPNFEMISIKRSAFMTNKNLLNVPHSHLEC